MLKTVGNPAVRYGNQTIADGNLVIGTAGYGIDFSADPSAAGMTSELLDDYEEGTWTPSGAGITLTTAIGQYTKIGRSVSISGYVQFPVNTDGNLAFFTGLPFTPANTEASIGNATISQTDYGAVLYGRTAANLPRFYLFDASGNVLTNANLSGKLVYFGSIFNV